MACTPTRDPVTDPLSWSVADLLAAYRSGTLSPVEVAEAALARIGEVDPGLHAYVCVTPELARDQAKAAETAYRRGDAGPLAGIPVSVKDAFHVAGVPTTLGSRFHLGDVASRDSGAVMRLRAAGAVFVGKTNVPEFCQSATTENLIGPDTANPWDPTRTPGGSSGGAAASVASATCPLAVGSDGGGSIRIPAAFTGLVGLKPTYGRCVDENGFRAFSRFIAPGPLAWRVDDARRGYSVLLDEPVGHSSRSGSRVAWCPRPEGRPVDDGVATATADAVERLGLIGHALAEVDLPVGGWADAFGPLVLAEEHDRRGHLLAGPEDLTDYESVTLEAGASLTAADIERAEAAVARHRQAVESVFESHDLIATPATAVPAFRLGERPNSIAGQAVGTLWGAFPFAVPYNVSGHPAIVLPVALVDGLPVAIQLVARLGDEARLLGVAEELEEALSLALWTRVPTVARR